MIVHLAGAAYSPEEAGGMAAIAAVLERAGFEVYLPSRDGLGPPPPMAGVGRMDHEKLAGVTFALAIFQVTDRCDCLVLNMNGRVPDAGGTFEAAVAFTVGRPVVLYKRDHRSELHGNDNAMLTGLSHDFSTVNSAERLPAELRRSIERYPPPAGTPARVPPHVLEAAQLGREVWLLLEESGRAGASKEPEDLFGRLAALYDASGVGRFASRG